MSAEQPTPREALRPSSHVDVSYGIADLGEIRTSTENPFPVIDRRQGFVGYDPKNVGHELERFDNNPTALLPNAPKVMAEPTSEGKFLLHIDHPEPTSEDAIAGRAILLKATRPGTYKLFAAQEGMNVEFAKGDMVIVLSGSTIDTAKLDSLLETNTPRLVSMYTNPEHIMNDLTLAFADHHLLRANNTTRALKDINGKVKDVPVESKPTMGLKFALMAHEGNEAQPGKPLTRWQELIGTKRRIERTWKIKQSHTKHILPTVEESSPEEEVVVEEISLPDIIDTPIIEQGDKPLEGGVQEPVQIPRTPSIDNWMAHLESELPNKDVARKLATDIDATYAGFPFALSHNPLVRVSGHTHEYPPSTILRKEIRPETAHDIYLLGMQNDKVEFDVMGLGLEGPKGRYTVDFFDFLVANLLYREEDHKNHIGAIRLMPESFTLPGAHDGVIRFDPETGPVHEFQISKEHARRNVEKCINAMGVSLSTLQEAIRVLFEERKGYALLQDGHDIKDFAIADELTPIAIA